MANVILTAFTNDVFEKLRTLTEIEDYVLDLVISIVEFASNPGNSRLVLLLGTLLISASIFAMGTIIILCRWYRLKMEVQCLPLSELFQLAKTAYEPGHTEMVIIAVKKHKCAVNQRDTTSGLTLFLCACLSGERRLVNALLRRGGDVRLCGNAGESPLYLATYGVLCKAPVDVQLIEDLISAGCEVNVQNYEGYTPLHRAASMGNIPVIRCLLNHGANVQLVSKHNIAPLHIALSLGHLEAAELLQKNSCMEE